MRELSEYTSLHPEAAPWYLDRRLDRRTQDTPPEPPRRITTERLRNACISTATVAALLGAWWLATALRLLPPLFLPSPAAVAASFAEVWSNGFVDSTLPQHLGASLARVFAALLLALITAVPLGLAMGVSPVVGAIADPVVEFLRPIPPLAYLPLVIIWCGIGEPSKVLVLWLAVFPPVLIATAMGAKSVAIERLRAALSLGASQRQLLRHVVFPSALPTILAGVRIGLAGGWSTLVAAELVAATRGLGFMIQSAAQFLVTDVVIMGIVVIAAVAFALEAIVRLAERTLVPWVGR